MDEFLRLKAISTNNASSRELDEFHVFAKVVAAYWENTGDGRGSEDRGEDYREEWRRQAAPVTDLLRAPGGKRRVIVPATALAPITLAETTDLTVTGLGDNKNQDNSTESASPSRSTAPVQLPAPSLPRPQHLPLLAVHHPGPSETAHKNSTRISEVSSRPSQREDVNRKCYASLDSKGLMKFPRSLSILLTETPR